MNIRLPVWLLVLLLFPLMVLAAIKPGDKPIPEEPKGPGTPVEVEKTGEAPAPAVNAPAAASVGPVYVFPLKEAVDPALLMFMRRTLKDAESKNASAFVIDMDTPGGRVDVTMEILEMLHKTKVPTYTFVNPHALSAGALISLGTKKIYMRPDATIGAAAVVTSGGGEVGDTMKLKLDSFMTAKMRAICAENGHNPDVAEAFVIPEKELKVGDSMIDSKETLLSLNGLEAAKLYDGKPLLAAGLAETVEDLIGKEKLAGQVIKVEPTGFEQLAFWITAISPLLLMGGIVGGYIEMKAPGFGIPGICSLICFGLFFGGHLIAGLAGLEVVVVFVIGLFLIILEIFVIPGTLVAGLIGTLMVLGSLLWAMVDYWPSNPDMPGNLDFAGPMQNFVIALAGTAVLIAILAKLLPKTSIYNRLVLSAAVAQGPAVSVPLVNLSVKIGDVGTASTTLRPGGKATFGDEMHDVVSSGAFITAGTSVRVVQIDGMRVVVESV